MGMCSKLPGIEKHTTSERQAEEHLNQQVFILYRACMHNKNDSRKFNWSQKKKKKRHLLSKHNLQRSVPDMKFE